MTTSSQGEAGALIVGHCNDCSTPAAHPGSSHFGSSRGEKRTRKSVTAVAGNTEKAISGGRGVDHSRWSLYPRL